MFIDSSMQLSNSLSDIGYITFIAIQFVYDIYGVKDRKKVFMNSYKTSHFIDTVIRESNVQIFDYIFETIGKLAEYSVS